MWIPLLFLAVSIHTDFDGGSIAKVTPVSDSHLRVALKGDRDQDGRNRQANWYYFRVDGTKSQPVTLDLVDLPGEYNYQANRGAVTKDTPPWWSEDGRSWRPVPDAEYNAEEPYMRLRIAPKGDRFWIAHVPPYTGQDLARLLAGYAGNRFLRSEAIGRTPGGRDIPLLTITDPSVADKDKKVLWWMFRQHAWEAGSSWAGEGMIQFLLSQDAQASAIRRGAVIKILPLCDPDGVAEGKVRFNRFGFDLNRNWDTAEPAHMPEIYAERKAIEDWLAAGHRIDFFLSLHNTETSEYVDGPAGPLLDRFSALLAKTANFSASRGPQPMETKADRGRFNVAMYLFGVRKVPAFLMEQRISKHPKLGRQPSPEDRRSFGRELVCAAWTALND